MSGTSDLRSMWWKARAHKMVNDVKAAGCVDCDLTPLRVANAHDLSLDEACQVFDMDHLFDKIASVSSLAGLAKSEGALERLRVELAKCEVVCANCHRIRTIRYTPSRRRPERTG